jgi:hypothetical protein
MKKPCKWPGFIAAGMILFFVACAGPVNLTSWKSPDRNAQVSKIAVLALFAKLEHIQPFEQSLDSYFASKGLKCIGSLEFLNPTVQYTLDQLKSKIDSLGADGVLVFTYKGTDETQNYIPPTYTGGWGWGWGGGYWGGGFYGGMTTGGYWTTTTTINLNTKLYVKDASEAIWTADITVTDPSSTSEAATTIAQKIYADWQKYNLVKNP